jgi:hypothetical protein
MSICETSVLTGQEGLIQFVPPGTTQCVRDFSDFGTDGDDTHITVHCEHDYRVNDMVIFREVNGANLDSAFTASQRSTRNVEGEILSFGTHVAGSGYGADQVYTDVALTGGNGTGATANITVTGGGISAVTLVSGGSGYLDTDQLSADANSLAGTGSGFTVEVDTVFTTAPAGDTCYWIVGKGPEWIQVSLTQNGTPIAVNHDGGTGSDDTELPAHISIEMCEFLTVCGVREFSLDISRDELDITTLPCEVGQGCDRMAQFRSTQAGYAEAEGTMSVYFTCSQENIANRLLGSSILKSQSGARVKLFVCAQMDSNGNVSDPDSLFVEADIAITGMSLSVNPDDPTTGELTFKVTRMISAFGMTA